jgi:signal transduction histidine kinase
MERLADAKTIRDNALIASHIQTFITGPRTPELKGEIVEWFSSMRRQYNYRGIFLIDLTGTVRLSMTTGNARIDSHAQAIAAEAMSTKNVVFSDLYSNNKEINLCLATPLLLPQGSDFISVGALLLNIDPHDFLYPLIQSWPTPSETSETLLVRREGDTVLYLNELRHRKQTALSLSMPISDERLTATMAALGKEGVLEGLDYRGVRVLAALRAIPKSPWYLVAKVDTEEIYAPLRERAWFVGILIAVLIVASGTGIAILWRERIGEEIRHLNVALEQRVAERTAQLEAANRELEAFSHSVSHDLKTPLIVIKGFSRVLSNSHAALLSDREREMLDIIQETTERMEQLINDLLAFSRSAQQQMNPSSINMEELARNTFNELHVLTPERKVTCTIKPIPSARGDQSMIRQVFVNLISNALKFTQRQPNPAIEIGSERMGDEIVYYVKDNGVGFDMEKADRLFSVFERLHGAEEFAGTGVGLSIVQRIIHRHGGRVWAEGKLNEGATFYFTIPGKESV